MSVMLDRMAFHLFFFEACALAAFFTSFAEHIFLFMFLSSLATSTCWLKLPDYSVPILNILSFYLCYDGRKVETALFLACRTRVPNVFQRGEAFISSNGFATESNLDELTVLKVTIVGCISRMHP